jgi:transcriptional regulator with XRE-family HTH domain
MIDGKRLRELREAHGYSRERFAAEIGVGTAQVARYERGENDATGDILARIAQFFNVSADYLLGLTDNASPNTTGELSPEEAAAIAAWREGDYWRAVKIMAADE